MRDEPSAPNATTAAIDAESLVLAATRATVTKVAPEELAVFDSVAAQWRRQADRDDWSAPGGSVGFGIESALVTELVMQVAAAAIGEVFSVAARRVQSGWRRWRRRRAGEPANAGTVLVPLGTENEARLREATGRHATALGLSPEQAGLLADAIVGALRSPPRQPTGTSGDAHRAADDER